MKNFFIISILIFYYSFSVYCQKVEIAGKVTDETGEPLIFASVALKGSIDGTTANEKGEFSFLTTVKGQQTLVGSYIGYQSCIKDIFIEEENIYVDLILTSKITQFQEVIITAGSFEASDVKRAVVLRSRDIGTTAGATGDITKAIETLPGVQTVGESNGLFVRGGSGSESKVFIDEMVVQNPYYSPVPDVKMRGRFDPFMFSGTVFSTGGYSALYGQALSSILSLKSHSLADSTNTGGGIHAYGTNLFHVHRCENTSIYLKGEYNNLTPYNNTFKQITEWEKSPENIGITLNFRHKISKNDMFKFYANYSRTELSMKYNNIDSINRESLFELKNNDLYINSTYKKYFNEEKWSVFIGTSYSKDIDDAYIDSTNMSEHEELGQGKIIITNSSLPGMTFFSGTEIQFKNVVGKEGLLTGEINDIYTAGFLEGNWAVTSNIGVRLGLRYEYSDFLKEWNIAPRLSMAYKTGKYSQVSFAYGKFYQTPENEFLYYNHNLDFENSIHYIVNYQLMKDKRILRIELYDKEYRSLIRNIPGQDKAFNNQGSGYARGIDIFWRDEKTISNADYWISYSFLDTKREYRDYPIPAAPDFVSKHNVTVVYKHWISKISSNVGFTYSYSSGRPYYNPQRPDSEFHKDITPAYNNLSFNISKMLRIFGRSSVIYISMDNVLGEDHIFGYYYLPDNAGRIPIRPSGIRSFFVGCFISTY